MLVCSVAALGDPPAPTVCTQPAGIRDIAIPSGGWPLRRAYQRLYSDRPKILEPISPHLSETRWDAIIISASSRLEAREAAGGAAIWPQPIACTREPRFLGTAGGRYIFATDYRAFAVSRQAGSIAWAFGEDPPERPLDDPEWTVSWTSHVLTDSRVFAASDRGDVVAIDCVTGGVLWRKSTGLPIGRLAASKDRVFLGIEAAHSVRVLIQDSETGRGLSEWSREEDSSIQSMESIGDRSLICLLSKSLICLDARSAGLRAFVTAPERFVQASLQFSGDRVMVSPDGRRLACYDISTMKLNWQTEPIWSGPQDRIWVQADGAMVFAAADEALSAYCLTDGRRIWQAIIPRLSRANSPCLSEEGVIAIAEGGKNEARRFQLVALARQTGRRLPIGDADAIETEPLSSLDEVHLRDRSLILVSGAQLIGYAANR